MTALHRSLPQPSSAERLRKKMGLLVRSVKTDDGERSYSIEEGSF